MIHEEYFGELVMTIVRYTDNTLATHPPGGKVHYVDADEADKLPSEIGRRKSAIASRGRKTAASRKSPPDVKAASRSRGRRRSVSVKKVARGGK